jgi:general secretion pathway protein A
MIAHWDGYYLMLWQSPIKNSKILYPGQSSRGVFWIRKQLALVPGYTLSTHYSDLFNEELKTEVIKFQKEQNLVSDGIAGPRTFIHLQNFDRKDLSPKLR